MRTFSSGIQAARERGIINAIRAYSDASHDEGLNRWTLHFVGAIRSGIAVGTPEQLGSCAKLVWQALYSSGKSRFWEGIESWGTIWEQLAQRGHQLPSAQLWLANGAFLALSAYGRAGDWPGFESWARRLTDLAVTSGSSVDFRVVLAESALNATSYYGDARLFGDLERWCLRLSEIAKSSGDRQELQLLSAKGAANAMQSYGAAKDWSALTRWGDQLADLAQRHRGIDELQYDFATAAFFAIHSYSVNEQWANVELWCHRLRQQRVECIGDLPTLLAQGQSFHHAYTMLLRNHMARAVVWIGDVEDVAEEMFSWGEPVLEDPRAAKLVSYFFSCVRRTDRNSSAEWSAAIQRLEQHPTGQRWWRYLPLP